LLNKNTIYVQFYSKFHSDGLILPFNINQYGCKCVDWFPQKEFIKDRKIALFALIAIHIQFFRYHFIFCLKWITNDKAVGMGGLTTESRLLALEHPVNQYYCHYINNRSKHKKLMTGESKFKTFYFFMVWD
jgi:hypothetical protein